MFWRLPGILLLMMAHAVAAEISVTVLATADLHGRIEQLSGPLASVLAAERRAAPDGVLFVDAGDLIQGTLLMHDTRGLAMVAALNAQQCDVWVPGNHEIEFGWNAMKKALAMFNGAVLAANLEAPEAAAMVRSWKMFHRNGIRIAVIGIMLPAMNNRYPLDRKRFETTPTLPALRRAAREALQAGAEVLILVRHVGLHTVGEDVFTLSSGVPEIQLIVGAHNHKGESGRAVGGAWYIQSPPFGTAVMRAVISVDAATRRVTQIVSAPIALPPAAPPPPDTTAVPPPGEPVFTLAARAMRAATGADLALYSNSAATLQALAAAPRTRAAYFKAYSYFDPVVTVTVSAAEAEAILREYLAFAARRRERLSGSGWRFQASRGRLVKLDFETSAPVYKLALTAYVAAGSGGYLPQTAAIVRAGRAAGTFSDPESAPPLLDCVFRLVNAQR